MADVAYGANGQFTYRQGVSGGIDCNNSVFGDPIFGTRKARYIRPRRDCDSASGQVNVPTNIEPSALPTAT